MTDELVNDLKLIIANWLLGAPKKTEFFAEELASELARKKGLKAESIFHEVLLYCHNQVSDAGTLWAHPAHTKRDTVFTVVLPLPFLQAAREADENAIAS